MTAFAVMRGRWFVVAVALLAAAGTARLGWWQLDRARQKLDLQASIESRVDLPPLAQRDLAVRADRPETVAAQHHRRVTLQGHWLAARTVYLDNRQMDGRQGFYVVTPLLLAPGDAVLVLRGFMLRDFNDRTRLAPLPTPDGGVRIAGRIAPPPGRLLELGTAEQGSIRQNLDLETMGREAGVPLRPVVVLQTEPAQAWGGPDAGPSASASAAAQDGLLRHWPAMAADVGKHHGYAFQWFALCALIIGLTLWFQFVRPARATRKTG